MKTLGTVALVSALSGCAPKPAESSDPPPASPPQSDPMPTDVPRRGAGFGGVTGEGAPRPAEGTPEPTPTAFAATGDAASCTQVSGLARYQGFGWSHFVILVNGCDRAVACNVASSVDPSPTYGVTVAPGQRSEQRTRYGSNTQQFGVVAECGWAR